MSMPCRVLLVEEDAAERQLVLSALGESKLVDCTVSVKDRNEALDFLHARNPFLGRPTGYPGVIVIGPRLAWGIGVALLADIRGDATLRRIPVVIVVVKPDAEMIRIAYEYGVNSLVAISEDVNVRVQRYALLAQYWGWSNEPPPGCLLQSNT
jgi:CheY-like chemotaxis protein